MGDAKKRELQLSKDAERILNIALLDVREEVIQSASRIQLTPGGTAVSAEAVRSALDLLGVGRFRKRYPLLPRSRPRRILWALIISSLFAAAFVAGVFVDHGGKGLALGAIGYLAGAFTFFLSFMIIKGNAQEIPENISVERLKLEAQLLREWAEVEALMRESLQRTIGVELAHSPVSTLSAKFLSALDATEDERKFFQELRRLRNAIVHGASEDISDDAIASSVDRARKLIQTIRIRMAQ
ncbi:hypothetical protein GCM10009677_27560 [Sphaerisporangium rubeum]|uniref:Uncharacterized protein n=1 Tax=Sphaerisporangium rubeum TaxID=321317 RepID=A0A7X0M6A9_9ACTN|nr:hypothetical protein [Sphaerisporangium rubeum]MBB6471666.1 hypothetical protein [Sphaerisporangium rubeum]